MGRQTTPVTEAAPSLALAAENTIRERILDLTLPPGMQLDETILREQLGISRTPAREALNRLVTEGLVVTQANRGFFVRSMDVGDVAKFLDAYVVSERSIVYFCRFDHPALVADLDAIQAEHSAAIAASDYRRVALANARFHARIAAATDNPYLVDFSKRIHNLARRLAFFVYRNESSEPAGLDEQQQHIIAEHKAVIDSIRSHDRQRLLLVMTEHAARFQRRVGRFVGDPARRRFDLPEDVRPTD